MGSGPSFTLRVLDAPSGRPYFVFDSRPGATVRGTVRVANKGDRAGTVRLYGVDAVTGQTTGAVYLARHDPRRDVGAWISLPIHRLTLAPGQSRVVAFRVRVPAGAQPGQHLGGIVAENATLKTASHQKTGRGSFRIDLRTLAILAVQLNLPGPRIEKLQLRSVKPGPAEGFQTLLLGMRNDGNQLLKGSGLMTVTDENGQRLKRAKFNVDTFVPQTAIAYPFVVPGEALAAGRYRAEVKITYGQGHIARLTRWFTISDQQIEQVFGSNSHGPASAGSTSILPLILAALALLLLGFLAAWAFLRRRGRQAPSSPFFYITAIHTPSGTGHEHIEVLQWQNPRTLETGQSTREGIVAWLNSGGDLRVRDPGGNESRVAVVNAEPQYVRTYAAGVWTNDLLLLPRY
ncbi:MAG: DUF3892 domain-containing protein [Thermoleophilia bacterium]|nr:DUF3892 domain-containing protein [Thermoleophilia bacterium]